MRIRLDISYDGTAFHGWAPQVGTRTVAGEILTALQRFLRPTDHTPKLVVAGRTDTGVHARGQVAHLDITQAQWEALPGRSTRTPAESLLVRFAGVLPTDVVVRQAQPAAPGFDARFSALWRRYAYRIADEPRLRDPLRRHDVTWLPRRLDTSAMNRAVEPLVGEHDFLPFCVPRPDASTIRTMLELHWDRDSEGLAVATVRADAFCHHMVRMIVGASLAVGEGRRPVTWLGELLATGRRDPAVPVAPPGGLTLEQVAYPADDDLAAQARRARRFRAAPDGVGEWPGSASGQSRGASEGLRQTCEARNKGPFGPPQ